MSAMDQNYAMYDGQQHKQVEALTASLAERLQRPFYPPLSQLPVHPIMSSSMVSEFRAQGSGTDLSNVSTVIEEVEETKMRDISRLNEEMKNYAKQVLEGRRPLEGHAATYQQLHAQLQKQQQQFQRPGAEVNVSASMSGSGPIALPAPLSSRAAGDVMYPALPQSGVLTSTQDVLSERRAAVVAAAKKTELQNMGVVKPGSPPPAEARSPPPTLASMAALHVEPPPPYVSNPSLAAHRNALLSQQPYSAHLANLMSNLSSLGTGGIPGVTSGLPGLGSTAGSLLGSLSLPATTQLPGLAGLTGLSGLTGLTQPLAGLQLPHLPSLTSTLAASTIPTLTAPTSVAQTLTNPAPQTWQNPTERESQNTCHSGACHAAQPMTMVPISAVPMPMSFPFAMHPVSPFCPGAWIPSSPVIWAMGTAGCCAAGTGCHGGGCCQQPPAGASPGYLGQRPAFPMQTFPSPAMMPPGPPGYRIPVPTTINPRAAVPTSAPAPQQQVSEKPKTY